jgi:hypothetical protein
MGIEPHFELWNYFFCARLRQGLDAKVVVLGSVDLFVRSGSRVDLHFCLPMFNPPVGWWKVWFFLRNDDDASLPSPPPEDLPSLGDLFSQQAGISVGAHRAK